MGKIIMVHPLELKPGADGAELERLVREDMAPIYGQLRQTAYLTKGNRGAHAGTYTLFIEIESADERDRVYLGFPEDAARVFSRSQQTWEMLATLVVAFPSPDYTDYEVLG